MRWRSHQAVRPFLKSPASDIPLVCCSAVKIYGVLWEPFSPGNHLLDNRVFSRFPLPQPRFAIGNNENGLIAFMFELKIY